MAFTSDGYGEEKLLHLATTSSYAELIRITEKRPGEEYGIDLTLQSSDEADWVRQVQSARDRFDVENDLGGLAISKIWGLASIDKLVAVCFTLHPGDMVEYLTAADERTTIAFASVDKEEARTGRPTIPWAELHHPQGRYDLDSNFKYNKDDVISLSEQKKSHLTHIIPWVLFSVGPNNKISRDPLSRQIVYGVHSFIHASEAFGGDFGWVSKEVVQHAERWLLEGNVDTSQTGMSDLEERCNICDTSFPRELQGPLRYTRCQNGHEFSE
jgi:hypothetical protein